MPSISIETVEPVRMGPTPGGVPVAIRSPGSSVMNCVHKANYSTDGKDHILAVEQRAHAQKVSNPLPRVHWPSLRCRSRAVTSFTQV